MPKGRPSQCFSLFPAQRGHCAVCLLPFVPDNIFSPLFSKSYSSKLKLLSSSFSPPIYDHVTSLEKWLDSWVHWNTLIEATDFTLDSKSIKLVVEGSFFPERSLTMSTSWKFFSNDVLLASGYFASTTELHWRNICSSEIFVCLSMFKFVECLQSHSKRTKKWALEIGTHYASVVNQLGCFPPVTPTSTFLHQVVREIWLIAKYLRLLVQPFKIKVHRDG